MDKAIETFDSTRLKNEPRYDVGHCFLMLKGLSKFQKVRRKPEEELRKLDQEKVSESSVDDFNTSVKTRAKGRKAQKKRANHRK
jgi:hypothetical protein